MLVVPRRELCSEGGREEGRVRGRRGCALPKKGKLSEGRGGKNEARDEREERG